MPTRPPTHKPARLIQPRPGGTKRGYDADWQRLRDEYLKAFPLCQCDDCVRDGLRRPANVVNHRIEIAVRPDLRLVWSNLQSMTKTCHDRHTARTHGFGAHERGSQ